MISTPSPQATEARRWALPFAATLLAMLCLQASNLGFSPLLPAIQSQFGLNFTQVGLFAGMYGLISVFVSIPAGLAIRRLGEKRILSGGLVVAALGLLLLSRADSVVSAFAGRGIWLSGYRCAFIAVMTAMALTCPPAVRGRSMGLLGAMSALASVLGAPFGSAIARDFGWRNGVAAFAAIAVVGGVIFTAVYRAHDEPGTKPSGAESQPGRSSPFLRPVVWGVALLCALAGVTSLTTNFFLPSALAGIFGWKAIDASYLVSIGFAVAIVVNLVFGFLMDKFEKFLAMSCVAALMIAGSLMMLSRDIDVFRIGSVVVLSLGHAAIQQSYSIAADVLRGRETGNVMGIVGGVAGLVNYLTPQGLGILRDRSGGFDAGWYVLAAIAAVTMALALLLRAQTKEVLWTTTAQG